MSAIEQQAGEEDSRPDAAVAPRGRSWTRVSCVCVGAVHTCVHVSHHLGGSRAPPLAQTVKNPPATWETWVQSLGWADALET